MKRTHKFSRLFLILRRGPQFKLPKREVKLLLHQSKTSGSIRDFWRSFFHRASLLLHRAKIPTSPEHLANRRKLLKSLFKAPKAPLMQKSKGPNLFLYTLSRPKAPPDERGKPPNILVQTLKGPSYAAPKDVKKSAREMWHGFRMLFKKPVNTEAMDAKEVSRLEAVRVVWSKDAKALKLGVLQLNSKFSALVVNHWKTGLLMLVLIPTLFELFLQSVSFMAWP